jgi:hypothetical protein
MRRFRAFKGEIYTLYSSPTLRLDEWILEETDAANEGFFVEINAGDGLTRNNTRMLEEIGWTGLLIEPDPKLFRQLQQNRPHCANVWASILPAGRRWTDAGMPHTLSDVLSGTPDIDFLSLNNGTECYTLADCFEACPKKVIHRMAVGYSLDQNKLKTLREILEPQGYILDQMRGYDACFKAK